MRNIWKDVAIFGVGLVFGTAVGFVTDSSVAAAAAAFAVVLLLYFVDDQPPGARA